jgi:hypothetical protein
MTADRNAATELEGVIAAPFDAPHAGAPPRDGAV